MIFSFELKRALKCRLEIEFPDIYHFGIHELSVRITLKRSHKRVQHILNTRPLQKQPSKIENLNNENKWPHKTCVFKFKPEYCYLIQRSTDRQSWANRHRRGCVAPNEHSICLGRFLLQYCTWCIWQKPQSHRNTEREEKKREREKIMEVLSLPSPSHSQIKVVVRPCFVVVNDRI